MAQKPPAVALPVLLPFEPKWDEKEAAEMRAWLMAPLGQRALQRLIYFRPLVTGTEPDKRRVLSDERAGFEACIAELMRLAEPVTPHP